MRKTLSRLLHRLSPTCKVTPMTYDQFYTAALHPKPFTGYRANQVLPNGQTIVACISTDDIKAVFSSLLLGYEHEVWRHDKYGHKLSGDKFTDYAVAKMRWHDVLRSVYGGVDQPMRSKPSAVKDAFAHMNAANTGKQAPSSPAEDRAFGTVLASPCDTGAEVYRQALLTIRGHLAYNEHRSKNGRRLVDELLVSHIEGVLGIHPAPTAEALEFRNARIVCQRHGFELGRADKYYTLTAKDGCTLYRTTLDMALAAARDVGLVAERNTVQF